MYNRSRLRYLFVITLQNAPKISKVCVSANKQLRMQSKEQEIFAIFGPYSASQAYAYKEELNAKFCVFETLSDWYSIRPEVMLAKLVKQIGRS